MDFNPIIFFESLPLLAKAALVTCYLTIASSVIGIMLGLIASLGRVSPNRLAKGFAAFYVLVFRTIPLLLTLTVLYYGLPSMGLNIPAPVVAIIGMSVTFGAYATEIFRAGIESVAPGQIRAARALGMSRSQAMRLVVMPQAIRRVLAPICNEVLATLKNSSLVSTIAIADLMRVGTEIMSWRANTFSPLLGVALGYFVLAIPLIWLSKYLESRVRVT